jgi:imidazolonepropionase-like amidohydrolase
MEYFTALGYSPLETIAAATSVSAAAIGRGSELGTIEPGKTADLLIIDGDPAQDVSLLRDKSRITHLFLDGREVALPRERGTIGAGFRPSEWVHKSFEEVRAAPPLAPAP